MGNGPGNIKEYIDAFYKYPTLQGGFAWEWANHGLLTKDIKSGDKFYAYGGDFGEEIHDSTFVMDGLLNSNHTPNSGLIEYKKAIEPVQILEADPKKPKFINRYDFVTLDHLRCDYTIVSASGVDPKSGSIEIPSAIGPGQTFELELPDVADTKHETLVNISFRLKDSTPYLKSGFEIATAQISITPSSLKTLTAPTTANLEVTTPSRNTLKIRSEKSVWEFNTLHGTLTSWLQGSTQLITKAPEIDFFRAQTDNDIPQDGWDWTDKRLPIAKASTRKVEWTQLSPSELSIVVTQRVAPPVLSWSIDCTLTYRFTSSGALHIHVSGRPKGENLPRTLPRIGLVMELPPQWQGATWFGRGPGESYVDSKFSQPVGLYAVPSIADLWVDYEVPQESSNRTDTRWLELRNGEARFLAQFVAKDGGLALFDWQAAHYRMRDVAGAGHPFELRRLRREEVVLRLDYRHHGLGSGSCGPRTLDEYALLTEDFEFEVLLQVA